MKVLITGANGFLGSHLLHRLQSKGRDVYALINSGSDNIPSNILTYDYSNIHECQNQFDTVFHLGALIPTNHTDESLLRGLNIEYTEKLTSLFPLATWVLSSSVSVYENCIGVINEDTSVNYSSLYADSKYEAEKIISKQKKYKILRLSSIYGKGMRSNTIIPNYINQARADNEILVYGRGKRFQDYVFIADALNYLEAVETAPNGTYLGVNGTPISNLDLAQAIKNKLGGTIKFLHHENEGKSYIYDNKKTKTALGIKNVTTIVEGIESMMQDT